MEVMAVNFNHHFFLYSNRKFVPVGAILIKLLSFFYPTNVN